MVEDKLANRSAASGENWMFGRKDIRSLGMFGVKDGYLETELLVCSSLLLLRARKFAAAILF